MSQDIVYIRQLKVQTLIGILPHERAAKQTLIISAELGTDFRQAAQTDDVQHALNYAAISDFIADFAANAPHGLLETFAAHLTDALFAAYPAHSIRLDIQKPGAIAATQHIGISQYRERPI
ncbi:MAG: dihydroneopterin aldolase [Cardiobacteriaceae bacterium]|nr:dihydroneopterin aldolase [Cardiobacteriaceae bacterium]